MIHAVLQAADFSHLSLASRCTSLMSIRLRESYRLKGIHDKHQHVIIDGHTDIQSCNMLKLETWKDNNVLFLQTQALLALKALTQKSLCSTSSCISLEGLGCLCKNKNKSSCPKGMNTLYTPQLRSSMLVLEEIGMLHSMNCDVATLRPHFAVSWDIHVLQGALWQEMNFKHNLIIQTLSQ